MTRIMFQTLAQAAEAYYGELRKFLLLRTGSPSLADDIVQETWIRASTTGAAMPDNPRAYLYRIAGNLATDHLRRTRTRAATVSEGDVPEEVPSDDPAPDRVVAARQDLGLLAEAIRELPPKCREVFLLYRGQGLTMRQIALRLEIAEKTVEKHIARGMVHCRRRLRETGRDI